jgi:hypothetical protein
VIQNSLYYGRNRDYDQTAKKSQAEAELLSYSFFASVSKVEEKVE